MWAVRALFAVMQDARVWRGSSCAHLAGRVVWTRSLRRQRRVHSQIVDLSEGGGSEGGRRRAVHDPIVLTIVDTTTT